MVQSLDNVYKMLADQKINMAPFAQIYLSHLDDPMTASKLFAQALANDPNPALSTEGKKLQAQIGETEQKQIESTARVNNLVAKTDEIRSKTSGVIYVNGKPLIDKNGNVTRTATNELALQKLQLDASKIDQKAKSDAARIASAGNIAAVKSQTAQYIAELKDKTDMKTLQAKAAQNGQDGAIKLIQAAQTRINTLYSNFDRLGNLKDKNGESMVVSEVTQLGNVIDNLTASINADKQTLQNVVSGGGSQAQGSNTSPSSQWTNALTPEQWAQYYNAPKGR